MVSVVEFAIILLAGNIGLPLGMPPGPEIEMMYRIAPDECAFYTTWTGMAALDPNANPTEKWMAQPEIQEYAKKIEKALFGQLKMQFDQMDSQNRELNMLSLALTRRMLTSASTVYVEDFRYRPDEIPLVTGGLVVHLGETAEDFKRQLNELQAKLPKSWKPSTVTLGKNSYFTFLIPDSEVPVFWAVRDQFLFATVGKGSAARLEKNAQSDVPQWLLDIRKNLAIERVATVSYLNMGPIHRAASAAIDDAPGPAADAAWAASGLNSLESVGWVTGLDSAGYLSRCSLDFGGLPTGAFSLLKGETIKDKYLSRIPNGVTAAVGTRFSMANLKKMISRMEPGGFEEAISELKEQTGVDLQTEFIDHFDDYISIYGTVSMVVPTKGWVASIGIKDSEKFAASYPKVSGIIETALKELMGGGRRPAREFEKVPAAEPDRGRITPVGRKIEKKVVDEFRRGPFAQIDDSDAEKIMVGDVEVTVLPIEGVPMPVKVYWCQSNGELLFSLDLNTLKKHLQGFKLERTLVSQEVVKSVLDFAKAQGHEDIVSINYLDTKKIIEIGYSLLPMARMMGIEIPEEFAPPEIEVLTNGMGPSVCGIFQTDVGFELIGRQTPPSSSALASVSILGGMALPAATTVRSAAAITQSQNNLRQFAIALHNYHDVFKGLPPEHTADADGKPLLSWRVHILPFIEQTALYDQFHLDEPWDSPHNKKLIAKMPAIFKHPTVKLPEGKTLYLAPVGDNTILSKPKPGRRRGNSLEMIANQDGTSNTIMLVEGNKLSAETWTKPGNFDPDGGQIRALLKGNWPNGKIIACFGDASVHLLSETIDEKALESLFNYRDGEVVDLDE